MSKQMQGLNQQIFDQKITIESLEQDLINTNNQLKLIKDGQLKETQHLRNTEKMLFDMRANQRMQDLRLKKYEETASEAQIDASKLQKTIKKLEKE